MEDVREVSAELHRLADAEPLDPFDTDAVLNRGRRGLRRRKLLTVGGAVVGVAAVAVAATLLPGNTQAGGKPPVAGSQQQDALFEPVPGVPRGEESVGKRLTMTEAERRCHLRFPGEKRGLETPYGGPFSGQRMSFKVIIGARATMCTVPGGDRPTAALLAEVAKDPVPKTTAGQLRNCSAQTWVDVTGWSVKATSWSSRVEGPLGTVEQALLIAVSPSGRMAIACEINKGSLDGDVISQGTSLMDLNHLRYDNNVFTRATATRPAQLWSLPNIGGNSDGYTTVGWGRLNGGATRVRLRMGATTKLDVPVTDGWFAYTWETGPTTAKIGDFTVTAYDKNGKVVKVLR
ncbi:MAG TPA: hypothetical protein VIH10_05270 [Kribbella sp.]